MHLKNSYQAWLVKEIHEIAALRPLLIRPRIYFLKSSISVDCILSKFNKFPNLYRDNIIKITF